MLAYAEDLTLRPGAMAEGRIEALRALGLSDLDVLQLCQCVSYYAYANRIAQGLGVGLESGSG